MFNLSNNGKYYMISDTDFYKITMSYAINKLYPDAHAEYALKIRNKDLPENFADMAIDQIEKLISFRENNNRKDLIYRFHDLFYKKIPFINGRDFDDYIHSISLKSNDIQYSIDNSGNLDITISGRWKDVIHYEIPVLTVLSELFHKLKTDDFKTRNAVDDVDYIINREIKNKIEEIIGIGIKYDFPIYISEFGTRRRVSRSYQEKIIKFLANKQYNSNFFKYTGTSNVELSIYNNSTPIGTMAHEWIQAHSVFAGLHNANNAALRAWNSVYKGNLGIALTDTYGTDLFIDNFDLDLAKLYDGLRHDSGDPLEFLSKMSALYHRYGIDKKTKQIIFSDSVTPDMIEKIINFEKSELKSGFKISFGIGSYLSGTIKGISDVPANMVIKLTSINGIPVCKLSDVPGKEFGKPIVIDYTKNVRDMYLKYRSERKNNA